MWNSKFFVINKVKTQNLAINQKSLEGVLKFLSEFEDMSGPEVSISKTSLFSSGVLESVLEE